MADRTLQRRAVLAALPASVARPAAAGDEGSAPTREPASIISEGPPRTRYFVEANPVLRVLTLYCSAGREAATGPTSWPRSCSLQIRPEPSPTTLQQLEGFEAECKRMEAMGCSELRINGSQ
jgi:hypothetical protein